MFMCIINKVSNLYSLHATQAGITTSSNERQATKKKDATHPATEQVRSGEEPR